MPARRAVTLNPRVAGLVRARLVNPRRLTLAQVRQLNRLTLAEVRALIRIRRKVGRGSRVVGFFIF